MESADLDPTAPTAVDDVCALARSVARKKVPAIRLLEVLDETSPCYRGLGTDECERLRGVCFSALETAEWEPNFDALVVEELKTSYHPAALAGAALAIRGCKSPPLGTLKVLADAFERIIPGDRRVDPREFQPALDEQHANTVTLELVKSFVAVVSSDQADPVLVERIRNSADRLKPSLSAQVHALLNEVKPVQACKTCCDGGGSTISRDVLFEISPKYWQASVEDQSGTRRPLSQVLLGKPSFLTFFYTRCMNPLKCSATITRLADIQRQFRDLHLPEPVNLVAMTYDPDYDTSKRLSAYGSDRGLECNDTVRLIRMPENSINFFSDLNVLVGYGPSTVNRHGLDAFLLDRNGKVVHSYVRQLFECDDVTDRLRALWRGRS